MDRKFFAEESLEKAKCYGDDPFIYFVVLWIGLNALYGEYSDRLEADKLKHLLKDNSDVVNRVRLGYISELRELFDFVSNEPQHQKLKEYIRSRRAVINLERKDIEVVDNFGEILLKIRNNLFHAAKLWDSEKESVLLGRVNPILRDLVESLLST